ncbi:hypothetical protein [Labedaea rhizosphaerae]|uniref:Uncharacterized protein n=1 Tax=Labedaea rhizosphaerae TaxID=598644 RepID=A0A4R6SI75_LABRH|nr:hypothetical protein [Labedaea rhizosphaerae]TDQ01290.1 hypothetical protein EV186_1021158 [Labedaea rhizosphaerae]
MTEHDRTCEDEQYRQQLADWVLGVLEQFEPFTPAQRDRLAALLTVPDAAAAADDEAEAA